MDALKDAEIISVKQVEQVQPRYEDLLLPTGYKLRADEADNPPSSVDVPNITPPISPDVIAPSLPNVTTNRTGNNPDADTSNQPPIIPPSSTLGRPIPRRRKCSVANMSRYKLFLIVILQSILLLGAIIAIVILAIGRSTSDTTTAKDSDGFSKNTSATIRGRGYLICGVVERPGFSTFDNATGTWSGFEVDLCRAIGAVIFGEVEDHVIFINLSISDRFIALRNGTVDLLAAGVTYTMERDLYEPTANAGFAFSTPYLYHGLSFAGLPEYVYCAESFNTTGNCSGLVICLQDNTTHVQVVESFFPDSFAGVINLAPTLFVFYWNFKQGYCNVLAGEQFDLAFSNVNRTGYNGEYKIGNNLYSKEPIALVTRDDDVTWSDYVNWVFLALLTAETRNISQTIAQSIVNNPGPSVVLSELPFYKAVAKVGNYAEMYNRNLESLVSRAPVNMQNNGTTPLIYSFPFGNTSAMAPGANGTLEAIRRRGYLLCGVGTADFFSRYNSTKHEWIGFDVDFCHAISAAIFNGTSNTVFIQVNTNERFKALDNGIIDVLIRATGVNYERDVNENKAKVGFAFSPPNFYTGLRFGGDPTHVDCAERVDVLSGSCSSLKICVNEGTTNIANAGRLFPNATIIPQPTEVDVYKCLDSKNTSVVIGGFSIFNATVREYFKNGTYIEGTKLFSRDILTPVTKQDDPQWSSFITWIMYALYYAEERNITQATYDKMPTVNLFGPSFENIFQTAVQAVGSYGEIFNRHAAGSEYLRSVLNTLNYGTGPLHFPPPGLFGLY